MSAPLPRHVRVAQIMGTAISVHVVGVSPDATVDAAAEACFAALREVDRVFSTYRDDSDISRIAAGTLTIADAHPWVAEVADACDEVELRTEGRFSAHWAGGFDPTGYVKGWALERAARQHLAPLVADGTWEAAGINGGGDIQVFTATGSSWVWQIGIVDPADRQRVLATVPVRTGAVATSGTAERGAHIVDPRADRTAVGVAGATVITDSLTDADVWATTAVVAGFDDLSWIRRMPSATGMLVADDGRVRRWIDGVEVSTISAA